MDNRNWEGLVARLESEAKQILKNNRHGVCVVTVHVAVDADGGPLVWAVPPGVRVEPSNEAKNVLLTLLTASRH